MELIEKRRSRALALLFGILAPGLGQLYNGERKRAAYVFGLFFGFGLLFRSILAIWLGYLFADLMMIAAVGVWLAGIVLAVRGAGRPRLVPAHGRWAIYGGAVAVAWVLVFASRAFMAAETYRVPSGSMVPTVWVGDTVMVNRWAYRGQLPARGDVIVFRYPKDESINYIKRVIGLPGDEIAIRDKVLYLNKKPVVAELRQDSKLAAGIENDEDRQVLSLYNENLEGLMHPVLYHTGSLLNAEYGPIVVPEGKYFVLGDNRDRASDSRAWGFVPKELVRGKVVYVQYSRDLITGRFRPERYGLKIE